MNLLPVLGVPFGGSRKLDSPLQLGNLHRWLDVNDLTTLFTTSGGSTNVATNNDPVGRWEDKSGNGRHVTQGTAGSRPLYKTNQDGTPGIKFDETDDFLSDTSIGIGTGFTIYLIAHATRSSFPGPGSNTDPNLTSGAGGGSTIEHSFYNAFVTTANAVSVCQQMNTTHWLNGAAYTEFNSITSNRTHAASGITGSPSSNTGYYLGKYSDGAHFSPDAIKGLLVYSVAHTLAEMALVYGWIMTPGRYRSSW